MENGRTANGLSWKLRHPRQAPERLGHAGIDRTDDLAASEIDIGHHARENILNEDMGQLLLLRAVELSLLPCCRGCTSLRRIHGL